MGNLFASDLFFLHAAGAVVCFRAAVVTVPGWFRQLLLVLISVYFLSWLSDCEIFGVILALYVLTALVYGWLVLRTGPWGRVLVVFSGCLNCLATLLVCKYQLFLPTLVRLHAVLVNLRGIEWIGLSYLTFRTIDYLFCLRSEPAGEESAGSSWLSGCSYLLFFPAYVCGPINRFRSYQEQASDCSPLTIRRIRDNLLRISLGIIKILIPGRLAHAYSILAADFPGVETVGFPVLVTSLYACYLYYYFDFSGYCDVAIALADFFEVRLPENFHYPFLASNPQDFWNRWHVSMTHWLRDFVFFRLFAFLTVRCPSIPELITLMFSSLLTLVVVGAWHGSSANWILYGYYHGLFFCLHLAYQRGMEAWCPAWYERLKENPAYRGVCIFLTFNYVAFGLLLTLPNASLPLLTSLIVD
jgi:D-alanyl-lipoteichoic acid acyltransferase DltB (MBOAT superfamily)